jgi:hypothetical protein
MWMFLASQGLERTAASDGRAEVIAAAEEYGYLWRHGMVGGWPLFVPGFFAVAIATAVWAGGRSPRTVAAEGIGVLMASTVVAKILAPIGTDRLVPAFEGYAAVSLPAEPLGSTWSGALLGMLTVTSWAALIVAVQVAVVRRSVRYVVVPLVLYLVLGSLRPGALGDLLRPWGRRLIDGDWVAAVSTLLIPVLAIWFWRHSVGDLRIAPTTTGAPRDDDGAPVA